MNVAIDSHGGANLVVALHATDGNGNIVNHAESLAMVRKRMVEAAANVNGDAIGQGLARGQNRSASRQPERLYEFGGKRNFELHLFLRAERAGLQLANILRDVDQQDVLIRSWLRREEVFGTGDSGFEQAVVDSAIFFGREDVCPDGKVIIVAVNEFEGKHAVCFHDTAA